MAEPTPRARARTKTTPDAITDTPDPVSPPAQTIKRTAEERKLAEAVTGAYQMIGVGVIGIGMRLGDEGLSGSGEKMVEMAESTADAWIDLARRNPKVRAYLVKITQASATANVIGMHVAMFTPLLASRGVFPGMPAMPEDVVQ